MKMARGRSTPLLRNTVGLVPSPKHTTVPLPRRSIVAGAWQGWEYRGSERTSGRHPASRCLRGNEEHGRGRDPQGTDPQRTAPHRGAPHTTRERLTQRERPTQETWEAETVSEIRTRYHTTERVFAAEVDRRGGLAEVGITKPV